MSNADQQSDVILVVVHPDTESVTWNVARAMKESIAAENLTATTYDLAASGFDPAFNSDDLAHFRGLAGVPVDVAEQQQMLRSAGERWCWFSRSIGGRCRHSPRAGSTASSHAASPMTIESPKPRAPSKACIWSRSAE